MAKFGLGQIGNDTPQWAKNIFRIYFFVSKALIGWAAATSLFSKETLGEILLFITLFLDPVVFGFSKMFGVNVEENKEEEEK